MGPSIVVLLKKRDVASPSLLFVLKASHCTTYDAVVVVAHVISDSVAPLRWDSSLLSHASQLQE
jgi:hypothetical protein